MSGVTPLLMLLRLCLGGFLIACFFLPSLCWSDDGDALQFGKEKVQSVELDARVAIKKLSEDIQGLKDEVIDLNKDVRLMEERILFPTTTKYSVFLSISGGEYFKIESVKLKIDGKLVTTHLYSEKQRMALSRGGIQKLYVTNLNQGKHSATAFFTGVGPDGRAYKRAKSLEFEKSPAGQYLEISIADDANIQEPIFALRQW
ncbi:hypothetical protein EDC56_1629 [Sinobacterium caligoides]|uniref:AraC family transcriptional regulator n=1 Tax=Sinobacterium caligoides TaxID=933926 RepID=A0A3N2DN14_9GAMM|nr:AraC family transcriptional regulator [Sinobacterium caligoides]ROS01201.1 hypothetical protein EDC56_1629 [Sinobacterium caligoides]